MLATDFGPRLAVELEDVLTAVPMVEVTSFDGEFQIPEPEALAMFGIGLLGMGGLIARRRRTAAQ